MRLRPAGARDGDRGSSLLLFPAGLLIVLLLSAVAVDLSNVWLQQRRLADAADSAANDAVTYGIDIARFRADGELTLDPDRVRAAVDGSIAGQSIDAEVSVSIPMIGTGDDGSPLVTVHLESSADMVFGRILSPGGISISATGSAVADDGVP